MRMKITLVIFLSTVVLVTGCGREMDGKEPNESTESPIVTTINVRIGDEQEEESKFDAKELENMQNTGVLCLIERSEIVETNESLPDEELDEYRSQGYSVSNFGLQIVYNSDGSYTYVPGYKLTSYELEDGTRLGKKEDMVFVSEDGTEYELYGMEFDTESGYAFVWVRPVGEK